MGFSLSETRDRLRDALLRTVWEEYSQRMGCWLEVNPVELLNCCHLGVLERVVGESSVCNFISINFWTHHKHNSLVPNGITIHSPLFLYLFIACLSSLKKATSAVFGFTFMNYKH